MPITIKIKEEKALGFLAKTTYILLGILITTAIFAALINQFQETGIWLSLIASFLISGLGFYFTSPKTPARLVIWTILITVSLGTITYFIALHFLTSALEGF